MVDSGGDESGGLGVGGGRDCVPTVVKVAKSTPYRSHQGQAAFGTVSSSPGHHSVI